MLKTETQKIEKVVSLLDKARRIFFITGAGISADSGLPTYRGIGGLYNTNTTDEGISIETALSGKMMEEDPAVTWKYLAQMEEACRAATYNRAHEVIAKMESVFEEVWVLTQNIDGFHQAAGSANVIDIHGDIHKLICMECGYNKEVKDYSALDEIPPRCPDCGGIVRPGVVLFGESLPQDRCEILMCEWQKGFDIVFSVGTTSVFPYIAQPVMEAKRRGIPAVEINPGETGVSHIVDIKIKGKAAEILDEIWKSGFIKS